MTTPSLWRRLVPLAARVFAPARAHAEASPGPPLPPHQFYGFDGSAMLDGASIRITNQAGHGVGSCKIAAGAWSIKVSATAAESVTFSIDDSEPSDTYEVTSGCSTMVELALPAATPIAEITVVSVTNQTDDAILADDDGGTGVVGLDVDENGTREAGVAFAGTGAVDESMSSVGPIVSGGQMNLGDGDAHVRIVTLRDKNGVPINGLDSGVEVKNVKGANLGFAFDESAAKALAKAKKTGDDAPPIANPKLMGAGEDGEYALGIRALTDTVGLHAFTVKIGKVTKAADHDGNPLEAHIGGPITGLSVVSVTNTDGDDILANGVARVAPFDLIRVAPFDLITVAPFDLITVVLCATGKDGLPPKNNSTITGLTRARGFVGVGAGSHELKTDNAGEVSVSFRADKASESLRFTGGASATAGLLVRVVDPDAEPVGTGPTVYQLPASADGTFHSWRGGPASSAVFENVANLTVVWKWAGGKWVDYVSDPAAPASTKTVFALSDGDVLFVVSDGPVTILLG